ncbi:MAG: maltose alpha-D-glucosyltransferase [Anaerolineaceae bacterium]|nr:maltose alpha-D-glucosyltransferase [Anaerolineaceae bacterium]
MNSSLWYKNIVLYQVYVRAFCDSNADGHGDLAGVTQKLDYLKELGINCIWLMPTYPSPLKDDGYDIADFYSVHPDFGTLDDFKTLIAEAHKRDLKIITDLVVNHTSDMHPWFQAARADRNSPYRDYYVWSDTDQKYSDARIIFIDTEPSNWTWDEMAGQYYWHRFYASQPDLNYDSPALRNEMLQVQRFWLDLGIDGFRVDAVPYLIEREGTNCENLPETHVFLKEMRRVIDEEYTDRVLLCEANQWPKDVLAYFGNDDEFQMAFNFPLMPRIYMSLYDADKTPIQWALENTPAIPKNAQWCTFLRNHDELTLEMVTEEERQHMWQAYAPDPKMRLNLGIRRRLAPLLENDIRKICLANAILFSLPGSPVIYYGDEIGMGDNIDLFDRNGVRTPMQWDASQNSGFSKADQLYAPIINMDPYSPSMVNVADQQKDENSLWSSVRNMIQIRNQNVVFGTGELILLQTSKAEVLAYTRKDVNETIFVINNLSDLAQEITLNIVSEKQKLKNLFTGNSFDLRENQLLLSLAPYQYLWLS